MELTPFLLDQWIGRKHTADPPIEFDLASSTGPVWTLRELVALGGEASLDFLLDMRVSYVAATGTTELREAIAPVVGAAPGDVQVTTGAEEALLILFFLAAEKGANVVLPSPGFPANAAMAESLGLETRFYHLRAENGFDLDLDEVRGLVDESTKLLLVNTPHNPTGAVMTAAEMEALHDFCVERNVPFVVDQVYHPVYFEEGAGTGARLPRAVRIGDFSKAMCLSGLRLGWIVEPDARRRALYLNARNYFSICSGAINERLGALAMKHSETIYNRARTVASRNLAGLDSFLAAHQDVLQWLRPRGGMTAYPWIAGVRDTRPFCEDLLRNGVMVAPGDCFGAPGHFRIGFAAAENATFARALQRFSDVLRRSV